MDGYRVSLLVHLLSLLAAIAASALVHFAEARLDRAGSVREALQWNRTAGKVARAFPIALVLLFASGAYMIAGANTWSWHTGWIEAGVLGVVALMVSGATIGARAAALGRALARLDAASESPAELPHDPLINTLSWANTGLAVMVVVVMTLKPTLGPALGTLAAGVAAGLVIAMPKRKAVADERVAPSV